MNAHLTNKIVKLEVQYAVNIESIPRMDWFNLDMRNDAAQIFSEQGYPQPHKKDLAQLKYARSLVD